MSTNVVYYPHAIYFGPTGTTVSQLSDIEPGYNFEHLTEFSASQAIPFFTGSHQAAPDIKFSSSQLKSLLDLATDYGVAKSFDTGNVDLEYKAGKNLGVRTPNATAAHIRARGTQNVMLVWESLTAKQGQIAEARCRLVYVQNPQTGLDPMVFTNSLALAQASDILHLFTLGPVKINGTWFYSVEEVSWNNNIVYEEEVSDGDGFLTYCGVKRYSPVLTITARKVDSMGTFGTKGTALSALSCFLRKKFKSGINVPDATAEHIGFTATSGTIKSIACKSSDKTMSTVEIHLQSDVQDTAPFTYSGSTAIS